MDRSAGKAGFTLTELTIVIVLVSVTSLALSGMFAEAVRSYQFVDVEKTLLQEARYAEERILRELGRVDRTGLREADPRAVGFVDRDSAAVAFSWSGVKGDPLVYSRNGVERSLAGGVDSLGFAYWRGDGSPAISASGAAASEIRRVTVFLRLRRPTLAGAELLANDTQSVDAMGGVLLRSR
jgi:prepilin-type N-terminal cleavage/methylation domain-containing protein